jgi:hypothetical protein
MIKPLPLLAALALLAAPSGHAQTLTAPEAAVLGRVIAHDCLDLVDAFIGCENVFLLHDGDDGADLIILPDARDPETTAPLLIARFATGLSGQ